jgi:DNA-binding NtrC family response regulator
MGFDLILLDTSLPDTTIYSLIPKLKELYPGIRVVTMTDHNTTEMERKIRKLGIIYYLIKPFEKDELKNILDHCSPNAKL